MSNNPGQHFSIKCGDEQNTSTSHGSTNHLLILWSCMQFSTILGQKQHRMPLIDIYNTRIFSSKATLSSTSVKKKCKLIFNTLFLLNCREYIAIQLYEKNANPIILICKLFCLQHLLLLYAWQTQQQYVHLTCHYVKSFAKRAEMNRISVLLHDVQKIC